MFGLFKKKNLNVNEVLDGLKIDDSSLFVPWGTNPDNLKEIFSGYTWRVGRIKILHCISERFGLEHHVNIINTRA